MMGLIVRTLDDIIAAAGEAEAERTRAEARAFLASTDWMIVRRAETGVEVPADILAQRQAAREALR